MSENQHPDFAAAERIARFEEQNSREYDANGPREITQLARAYLALRVELATHHAKIVEAVEGCRRDTTLEMHRQHPVANDYMTCVGCGVSEMYFTADGHACEYHNECVDAVLAALAALDPRGGR